jgi:hypothetical protein
LWSAKLKLPSQARLAIRRAGQPSLITALCLGRERVSGFAGLWPL